MAELTADLFVSLDGYAGATDAGPFFDHGGPELDGWVRDASDRPQLILMGRVTYEAMSAMSSATDEASVRLNELPKAVFSNTLHEPLTWTNTRLVSGDLVERIGGLKRESADPIRTIGSLTLVRSLLDVGLVDRLRLMVFPLIIGPSGREPAFADHGRTDLELVDTTTLDSRLVLLDYRPVGDRGPR